MLISALQQSAFNLLFSTRDCRGHCPLGDGEQNRDRESISRTRVSILIGESPGMQMIEEKEAIHELKFLMVGPSPAGLRDPINILRNQSWLTLISAPGL